MKVKLFNTDEIYDLCFSCDFFRKLEDEYKEVELSVYVSETFFERHLDKVDWPALSKNPSLSEAFFEKHIDTSGGAGQQSRKVNWPVFSKNPSLSEAF